MSEPIHVPAGFRADFELMCSHYQYTTRERALMRDAIRENFETMGPHVQALAKVLRFCDETWGFMPTPEMCRGYLASKGWHPADPGIFARWGVILLATQCSEVAGVFNDDASFSADSLRTPLGS